MTSGAKNFSHASPWYWKINNDPRKAYGLLQTSRTQSSTSGNGSGLPSSFRHVVIWSLRFWSHIFTLVVNATFFSAMRFPSKNPPVIQRCSALACRSAFQIKELDVIGRFVSKRSCSWRATYNSKAALCIAIALVFSCVDSVRACATRDLYNSWTCWGIALNSKWWRAKMALLVAKRSAGSVISFNAVATTSLRYKWCALILFGRRCSAVSIRPVKRANTLSSGGQTMQVV